MKARVKETGVLIDVIPRFNAITLRIDPSDIAVASVKYADALIKELK